MGEAEAPERLRINPGLSEVTIRSRVLPMSIPYRSRAPLEIIRFAAANHLCVDLTYDGSVRRIEPYSLRQTAEGNFVLHSIRSDTGEHRSYRIDRMQGASVASQSFTPRYLVELSSEGPLPVAPSTARPSTARADPWGVRAAPRRAPAHSGPTYVYRCTVCGKTFDRKSMDGTLNPHKNKSGYDCYGRHGVYVRTKY